MVTGGAGFIGSHLADELLSRGNDVVVVDNEATGNPDDVPSGAEYHRIDVRDREVLWPVLSSGIDCVFHVAGQVSSIRSFEDPRFDFDVNLGGTMSVVDGCVEYGVPRIFYASSMTVYGHPHALPLHEGQNTDPVSYYGISKYAAERYVLATAQRPDLKASFDATSFRMFNVYGPRQALDNPYQGVMAIFLSKLLNNEEVKIFGDGEQTRDFVFVGDVVEAWVSSMDQPSTVGKAYNIGSGFAISMNGLVRRLQEVTRKCDAIVNYYPARPGEQRHVLADVTMAREDFGWVPRKPFDDGVEETVEWCESLLHGCDSS